MMIQVLVCREDGTQVLEEKQVPDNYFANEHADAPAQEAAQ